jgi:glycine/D-amino acid oxidase-like deaminating enzyme
VLIVGGGIIGLSVAHCALKGHQVTVVERGEAAGWRLFV